MQNSENRNKTIFIDYIPAELHENKTWEIVYYVKSPFTEKLQRKRNRVKPLKMNFISIKPLLTWLTQKELQKMQFIYTTK